MCAFVEALVASTSHPPACQGSASVRSARFRSQLGQLLAGAAALAAQHGFRESPSTPAQRQAPALRQLTACMSDTEDAGHGRRACPLPAHPRAGRKILLLRMLPAPPQPTFPCRTPAGNAVLGSKKGPAPGFCRLPLLSCLSVATVQASKEASLSIVPARPGCTPAKEHPRTVEVGGALRSESHRPLCPGAKPVTRSLLSYGDPANVYGPGFGWGGANFLPSSCCVLGLV